MASPKANVREVSEMLFSDLIFCNNENNNNRDNFDV